MSSLNATAITPIFLAKMSLESYLKNQIRVKAPDNLPNYLQLKAGCFVSLKTKQGDLRGCIGTLFPVCNNVAEEIIRNAVEAATQDYRFKPVTLEELDNLTYSVDILSPLEPIEDLRGHDVQIYGLLIEAIGGKRAVLLPALPGIDTTEAQLIALHHKAGISADTPVKMSRFSVDRYGDK
ncbi:MAG: AmmeMemoRadiSam system protein A [Blastocatellia bacterium]|nr:AmmeMemoRadiSam system protein A [Blastocatellia bacterium]MBL8195899.1 AmmeMemoRadiSam system protein A [Blastocatellia bacterium]MBN8722638.1 AmmeMemoRadiSam system protein A [Acidobacteriota bacterium]